MTRASQWVIWGSAGIALLCAVIGELTGVWLNWLIVICMLVVIWVSSRQAGGTDEPR